MKIKCIFCKSTSNSFKTKEHILPESLGGKNWALLKPGLMCDGCQNKFGSNIEQQALSDYPFHLIRIFFNIPTKKGKSAWTKHYRGILHSSGIPGLFNIAPSDSKVFDAISIGKITQMRVLAEPRKPEIICRFLLKMGLEVVANDKTEDIFDEKFDHAREFALTGHKQWAWWYMGIEKENDFLSSIKNGFGSSKWSDETLLEVVNVGDGAEAFHLKLMGFDFIVPLESRIVMPIRDASMSEQKYRIYSV